MWRHSLDVLIKHLNLVGWALDLDMYKMPPLSPSASQNSIIMSGQKSFSFMVTLKESDSGSVFRFETRKAGHIEMYLLDHPKREQSLQYRLVRMKCAPYYRRGNPNPE